MNPLTPQDLAKLKAVGTVRIHRCFVPAPKLERQTGRKPNTKCIVCSGEFYARPYVLRKGEGKFCSMVCYGEWKARKGG